MKITNILPTNAVNKAYQANRTVKTESTEARKDQVEFSQDGLAFSAAVKEVKRQLAAEDPARAARIHQLTEQIEKGEYSVSAEDLVNKMLG